jgi:hypothetical protein
MLGFFRISQELAERLLETSNPLGKNVGLVTSTVNLQVSTQQFLGCPETQFFC